MRAGRANHPTEGKTLSVEHRQKIAKALSVRWDNISDEEKQKVVDRCAKQWSEMKSEDRARLFQLAREALLETRQKGSKLERLIMIELRKLNLRPEFHAETTLKNEKMHIDILLPDNKIAIEVDGPVHFFPIWGADRLQAQMDADGLKNTLLLNDGYYVIRIKIVEDNLSDYLLWHYTNAVVDQVKSILNDKPKCHFFRIERTTDERPTEDD